MNKIRWGVLGNSTIGRKCVLPAIYSSKNGVIRALATRNPNGAEEVARVNGIELLQDDYNRVLDDPEIDAVYLPLPNHLHLPWTLKALEAGKHVLCEKPLACSVKEARQMADAATRNDRLLMEALMYRFHPRSQRVKELIAEGAVGKPLLIRAAFCFSMEPALLQSGDNHRLKKGGGGALLDVGSYGVSVARWLANAEPVSVQAQAIFHHIDDVDMHLVGSLLFADDTLASIEASFCSGLQQTYTVVGSDGAIELPHDAFIPWENDALVELRSKDQERGQKIVIAGIDEYRLMVEHFAEAVLTGCAPTVTLDDSIANLAALDALAEAARSGKRVTLAG